MSHSEKLVAGIMIAVLVVAFVIAFARSFRRGGLGPVQKVPPLTKGARLRQNAAWKKHGWVPNYDDNGDPIPHDERVEMRRRQ